MKNHPRLHLARLSCALLVAASATLTSLNADVIETNNGSILHGKVVASDGGVIKIETDFAGVVAIKQDQVKSITTDDLINVALTDGNNVNGRIATSGAAVQVRGTSGSLATKTADITALWRDGDKSPAQKAQEALQRKWGYELAFDLNGRNGNSDRAFLGLSGRAVLQGATDRLMFYGNYSRSEENDATTQDEGKGGVDYSNFFTNKMSWYVRTELGYDHTKDLSLRSQSAAGIGYTMIKKAEQTLEGRVGLSYRFENYGDPLTPDFDSAGIDLGLLHNLNTSWGRLTQTISLTPSFEDFSNFVFIHDSALELPIKGDKPWKVRVGIRTDYTSEPPPGFEELDWTYYTQLVLSWQ
jgi:hypothetical protein